MIGIDCAPHIADSATRIFCFEIKETERKDLGERDGGRKSKDKRRARRRRSFYFSLALFWALFVFISRASILSVCSFGIIRIIDRQLDVTNIAHHITFHILRKVKSKKVNTGQYGKREWKRKRELGNKASEHKRI